jgi:outer membrane protein TolC
LIEGTSTISNVATGSGGKQNTGYYSANLDASWEIPIYGQLGDTNKVANAQIAFAESDVKAVRASVISEAVRLYTKMRSKQNEVEKRKIILSSYEKIADYQKIKHNAGLITDSEMSMSNRSLLMAQNELKITENESVISMRQLAKLFGLSEPDKIWKNIATIPTFDVPSFSDTPLDVLRNRPDIRKAEASVLVAAGKLKLSKSQMYPKLNITGSLSQLGNIMGDPLSGNIVQLSSVPSISIPLLDWSKRFTATKVNEETLREKASIYRETVISAMNEVEESWSAYKTALTTEKSASKIKNISDKASKHKILLFKEGISDGIEAENAIIDAASASIIQLQAKADTITKLTLLTKALGGVAAKTITEKKND